MKIVFYIVFVFAIVVYAQNGAILSENSLKNFSKISKIIIAGNKKTKESVVRREMDFAENSLLPKKEIPEILEKTRNKIFNTGLFVSVQVLPDTSEVGFLKVFVVLEERWYTIPNIVFELADRNFNEWWYQRNHDIKRINYGFGVHQHNIRGRNETFRINLQGGFTKNISAGYSIPYLNKNKTLGSYIGIGFTENKQIASHSEGNKQVFTKSEHVLFYKKYLYTGLTYRKSFFTTHKLNYDFSKFYAHDTLLKQKDDFFEPTNAKNNVHINTITYVMLQDKRNVQAYATKGFINFFEIKKTGLLSSDYYKNWQFSASHAHYYELGHNFYINNKTKLLFSANDAIPYYNRKALGYNNDYIRGYDLYVLDASSYFYNKLTLRKKILSYQVNLSGLMPIKQFRSFPVSVYMNTYADMGYGYKKKVDISNALLLNRSLEGFGVGIDIVSAYDVVIRAEYSFNELGQRRLFFYVTTDVLY